MGGFVKGDVVVVPFPFSDLVHDRPSRGQDGEQEEEVGATGDSVPGIVAPLENGSRGVEAPSRGG